MPYNPPDKPDFTIPRESAETTLYRIRSLEETVGQLNKDLNQQAEAITLAEETAKTRTQYTHTNLVRNGDFDFDRNDYLYTSDDADADVEEECAHWYVAPEDTAVESTGAITASDATLDLDTTDFIAGDAGEEIVVEGAGTAGADHVTTIASYTDSNTVELTDNAVSTVSGARVRWRLLALTEDSTDVDEDTDVTTNSALKTSDHTRYSGGGIINNPHWNKADGWMEVSAVDRLCAPMPRIVFKPAKSYFVGFNYKLAGQVDSEDDYAILPYAGLWDNTSGRRNFLEADDQQLTTTVVGSPAGTTSRDYFVVFTTRGGQLIGTTVETEASAPNDASYITNSVYVDISYTVPAGTTKIEVYRKSGATYHLIKLPYPQSSTRDDGNTLATVGGYPTVDLTRSRACTEATAEFPPATQSWQRGVIRVDVPPNYDQSKTTDQQWLVWGLQAQITGTGSTRVLQIDQISVDEKFGVYSDSPYDILAKRGTSSAPTEGDPPPEQGGGGIPEGGGSCPTFKEPVLVEVKGLGRILVRAIDMVNAVDTKIINRAGDAVSFTARPSKKKKVVFEMLTDDSRAVKCSRLQRFFRHKDDKIGKPLQDIVRGDTILNRDGRLSRVLSNVRQVQKEYVVKISITEGDEHGYWITDFGVSNVKEDPLED